MKEPHVAEKRSRAPEVLFVFGALFFVPALISLLVSGGAVLQVLCALLFWYAFLFLALGGLSVARGEGLGWTMIMGLFFSWLGVPIVTVILRYTNLPYRWF